MNSPDPLETLLRGFRPRTPSPRVREALFGTPAVALHRSALQIWFAPLAAAAVVVLSLATAWSPVGGNPVSVSAFAAIPPSWAASGVEQNALPRPTFPATGGFAASATAAATSAVTGLNTHFGALLIRQTNFLAR